MSSAWRFSALALAVLLPFSPVAVAPAHAAPPAPEHWVGTWAAAPVSTPNFPRARPPMATAATNAPAPSAPSPATPPTPPPAPSGFRETPAVTVDPSQIYGAKDMTLREIVHVSLGGSTMRVVLTNEFGTEPLTIGAAHVAISEGGASVNTVTAAGLTFGGRPSIAIPPGALAVSDPVAMTLPEAADLAVSLFVPTQPMRVISVHGFADQTSYTAPGNVVGAKALDAPEKIASWPFLKGVDVKVGGNDASIVAFGDSITDGAHSTLDANSRWPDLLAHRLAADKRTAGYGVLNEGIGGNRILHDNTGPSALARFDRDVIAQAGVKYVILLEGINDIGHAADPVRPYDVVSVDDLIAGYTQLIERAHIHGIKVIGATLTPYTGAGYMSPVGESIRQALNDWIRATPTLDGMVDFDKATRDPANPAVFAPAADSGDHLHPGDAGYKAMADAIDLNLFSATK